MRYTQPSFRSSCDSTFRRPAHEDDWARARQVLSAAQGYPSTQTGRRIRQGNRRDARQEIGRNRETNLRIGMHEEAMMFCSSCGTTMQSEFCPSCGTRASAVIAPGAFCESGYRCGPACRWLSHRLNPGDRGRARYRLDTDHRRRDTRLRPIYLLAAA